MADQLLERPRPGRVDHRQPGHAIDQAQVLQLDQRLAERARVPQVAPGHHDPVGDLPPQPLEDPEDDRLLPLQPERIDRVHQVDAQPVGDLPDSMHGIIEVADDLDRQGPVIQRLRQLAVGDLSRADEDDRPEPQVGRRAVDRQRRRRVPRARAGHPMSRYHASMRECRRHTIIFEASGGVHALVLEPEAGGFEADVPGDLVGGLEEGLAFADGDDELGGSEGEEVAEPPDAGEVEGIEAGGPSGLELVEAAGDGEVVPVVDDVDEIGANRAGEMSLVDGEGGRAGGVDALLIGGGHRGGALGTGGLLDHGSLGPSPPRSGACVRPGGPRAGRRPAPCPGSATPAHAPHSTGRRAASTSEEPAPAGRRFPARPGPGSISGRDSSLILEFNCMRLTRGLDRW